MAIKWMTIGAALLAGCNSDMAAQPPVPIVQMIVDADRNGTTDPAADGDVMYRNVFDATHGAIFLANVDDDDADQKVDATDEKVNGDADALDLARINVVAWPMAPDLATGVITIEPAAEVRVFRHNTDGSWATVTSGTELAVEDLRAGVELGIEALDFPHPGWDGLAHLHWQVSQAPAMGQQEAAPKVLGSDDVVLRAAPLVLQSNLDIPEQIYLASISFDNNSPKFIADVKVGAMEASDVPVVEIDAQDERYANDQHFPDQWTQDIFEVGYTTMPGAKGPHGMHVVIRTPVPDRIAADYTQDEMLAPDFGWVWKHSTPYKRDGASASLDSFGNLDSIPPYDHGDSHFPLGRVVMGSIPTRHVDDALRDFLNAQGRGTSLYLDTSWLLVGHVDEVMSFVKANTPRGWKLLLASPARAKQILTDLVTKDPNNGAVKVFAGQKWFDDTFTKEVPAQVTITALLADTDRLAASELAQTKIDAIRTVLQAEIGLTDDEIIDIPVLFEGVDSGGETDYVAYTPGLVNLLHLNGTLLPPAAHGPLIGNKDALAADFEAQTTPLGDTTSWVEDWNLYHRLDGEVHCGTNVTRKIPAKQWWEVLR